MIVVKQKIELHEQIEAWQVLLNTNSYMDVCLYQILIGGVGGGGMLLCQSEF